MSRISTLVLTAAVFCLVVTVAVQGQGQGRQGGGRGQQAVALPDGAGKDMVQGLCAACHNLNMITGLHRLHAGAVAGPDQHDGQACPSRSGRR